MFHSKHRALFWFGELPTGCQKLLRLFDGRLLKGIRKKDVLRLRSRDHCEQKYDYFANIR